MVLWQAPNCSLVYPIIPVQVKAQFDWIILSSDGMPPPQSFKAILSPTVAHSFQMGTSGSASSTMNDQCQCMLAFFCVHFGNASQLALNLQTGGPRLLSEYTISKGFSFGHPK